MQTTRSAPVPLHRTVALGLVVCSLLACSFAVLPCAAASKPKKHTVTLGNSHHVPYTPPEATAETKSAEASTLRVRPLYVDDTQREWTVGELHEITDHTFTIRRVLRLNDALPGKPEHWSWQPSIWLLVDRVSGHITALHLPAFDASVSDLVWFRDYAAYCGITTTKSGGLVAIVAQLGRTKAVAERVISKWPQAAPEHPVCSAALWQQTPMRATITPTGAAPITFDVVGTSSLVEEGESAESP